jgi:hypothetical protein
MAGARSAPDLARSVAALVAEFGATAAALIVAAPRSAAE